MASTESRQTFENHVQRVSSVYTAGFLFAGLAALYAVAKVLAAPSLDSAANLLTALALLVALSFVRTNALRVQDRVIRLEMRVRLRHVLPADLQERIGELTLSQLISLRFASDAELPALTRRVLEEKLTDRNAIKKLVTDWQADSFRV
jgi:hypothetical protein